MLHDVSIIKTMRSRCTDCISSRSSPLLWNQFFSR